MDFTRERNEDLMRVFHVHISDVEFIVMPEIFQKVADSPASRFWVSEERAAIVVSMMLAGRPLPRMRDNKREMFEEIFRRVVAIRQHEPEASVYELVSRVVRQPAPKFFLTARTVGEIIYRIKKGWYENQFDRYRGCTDNV